MPYKVLNVSKDGLETKLNSDEYKGMKVVAMSHETGSNSAYVTVILEGARMGGIRRNTTRRRRM